MRHKSYWVLVYSVHAGSLSNRISVEHLCWVLYMKLSFFTSHNRLWCGQASGGDKQTSLIYWLISLLVSGWLSRRLKEHKIRENKLWRHRTVPLQTPPCHSCDISQEMGNERCFLFKGSGLIYIASDLNLTLSFALSASNVCMCVRVMDVYTHTYKHKHIPKHTYICCKI